MAIEDVVIAYKADISDIEQKVKSVQRINQKLAQLMGKDFSQSFTVIKDQLSKVQFNKQFKITADDGSIKKVVGTVSTFEKTVQTADGQLFKLTETIGKSSKGSEVLASSINKITKAEKDLIGASKQLKTNFSSLKSVNASFSKEMTQFGQATKFLGTSLNQVSATGSKVSKIFETADGKFVQMTETTKKLPNGIQQVDRSVKELSKSQLQNISTTEGLNKSSRSLGQNLKTLLGRALLTIPVWFALRQGIATVFRTIKDGLKNLAEFDKALQKLNRNLEATAKDGVVNLDTLANKITAFSLKTGKSVEEITNAIQKFATVGFDLETSLTGGLSATKLAITLFGDVEGTAQAFARSLRVLTEDMDTAEEKQQAIAEALALTDQLWQTNAFEINEFSQNLTKFAGVANIANISIEDTLTLLATLSTGGLANRAGRLLRSTLLRALQDIDKVTKVLDLDFDAQSDSTINFILELVGALKEMKTVNNVPVELAETLGELFTVRSTEVVASLVSLEKTLKQNIALKPDLDKFNATFEEQLTKINRLVERHKNLNKEMGKAFVTGLLGAGNYGIALEKLISIQENLNRDTERLGNVIRDAFVVTGIASIIAFRVQLTKLLVLMASPVVLGAVAGFTVLNFKSQAERLAKEAGDASKIYNEIGSDIAKEINNGLKGALSLEALEVLIAKIDAGGLQNLGFTGDLERTVILLKEIRDLEKQTEKVKVQQTKADEENTIINTKKKKISELILKNELQILKLQGATESQLLKNEIILRKQLNIEKDSLEQLNDKLDVQRKINEEKQLETSLSSRTTKLAEIAQTDGIDVARKVGEVLRGEVDFDLFERLGGRPLEVFKDKFNDIFKEQKNIKFLQEKGFSIPIDIKDEVKVRGETGNIRATASIEQRRAEAYVVSLSKGAIATDKNTSAQSSTTQSLQQLNTILSQGGVLKGADAQDYLRNEVNKGQNISSIGERIAPAKQTIDITINIDGKNLRFQGTPEAIRQLAGQVSVEVGKAVEDKLVNDLNTNNSAPISKATDGRTGKY